MQQTRSLHKPMCLASLIGSNQSYWFAISQANDRGTEPKMGSLGKGLEM